MLFGVVGMIMKLAPLGAFGAMAFTIGNFGVGTLAQLGKLIACFYAACFLFVAVVLNAVARFPHLGNMRAYVSPTRSAAPCAGRTSRSGT